MDIKDEIKLLCQKARLSLSKEETKLFEKQLIDFKKALKLFDELNLDGVEEAVTPFSVHGNVLRSDDKVENNSFNILSNASKTKDGYIVLDKEGDK